MIEASQSIIVEQNNPAINRHFELGIKTLLQNVPRHADDKLERLLKVKEKGHYVLGPEDGFQEGYKMGLQDGWSKGFDDGFEEAVRPFTQDER